MTWPARGDAAGKGSRPHTEFYGCKGCGFHADRCKWKGTQTFRLQGKKVYIKFWASWCSVCMATLADTDMLAGSDDKDFVVLSVVAPGFGGEMKKRIS